MLHSKSVVSRVRLELQGVVATYVGDRLQAEVWIEHEQVQIWWWNGHQIWRRV